MFSWDRDKIGRVKNYQYHFALHTKQPFYRKQYPIPIAMLPRIPKEVNTLLKQGVIEYANSLWNSPALFVEKPDKSIRVLLDAKFLNKATIFTTASLPSVTEALNEIGGHRWYVQADIRSPYVNVEITEESRDVTGFSLQNLR